MKWVGVPLGRCIPLPQGEQALLPEKGLGRKSQCRRTGSSGQGGGEPVLVPEKQCLVCALGQPDSHYFYFYDLVETRQPHSQQVFPGGHSATPQGGKYPPRSTSSLQSIFLYFLSISPCLSPCLTGVCCQSSPNGSPKCLPW